jgi:hypothetical protein
MWIQCAKISAWNPPSYCSRNFGTGPFGTRDGKILPDLGTQRRLGTACSSALARWALDLIQGGIYSPADTLFSTCFGHGTQQCPNFRDWNRLKSSSSWYGSKNEDHWVGDLSPEQLWGGGKYSAGQERRLKNGWICFFYCELYVSLSFSIWLAKSRYKYSIWFHDWWFQPVARCYWCYNYGWIVVNIHMSRDMNLASMVKYPVITWTVHPSILVENHIGEYNPLLHQSLSAAVHRGLPLIWGS